MPGLKWTAVAINGAHLNPHPPGPFDRSRVPFSRAFSRPPNGGFARPGPSLWGTVVFRSAVLEDLALTMVKNLRH